MKNAQTLRPSDGPTAAELDRKGPAFWLAVLISWPVIGYSVYAMNEARFVEPADAVRWAAGALIVHDLFWLPLLGVIAFVIGRLVPERIRIPVGWALATSAMFVAVGWPFYREYGARANDPSLLPRDYAAGVRVYVLVIIGAAVAWSVARLVRGRRGATRSG